VIGASHYYNRVFAKCGDPLTSDGIALVRAIAITDWSHGQVKVLGRGRLFYRLRRFHYWRRQRGFKERAINFVHMMLAKPDNRSGIPATLR